MRFLVSIPVALVSSAVALLIAAVVLDGFDISTLAFPVLVVEFALILVIARAAIETLVDRNVQVSSCFAGLIGAFAALLVTDLLPDGLDIEGTSTWILATLIVWGGMIRADLLIGRRLCRRLAGDDR